jgi:hypothetical protein
MGSLFASNDVDAGETESSCRETRLAAVNNRLSGGIERRCDNDLVVLGRSAGQKLNEGDSSMAETDWLIEAKTAYERGNAYAAAAAALMDIANTLRIQNGRD